MRCGVSSLKCFDGEDLSMHFSYSFCPDLKMTGIDNYLCRLGKQKKNATISIERLDRLASERKRRKEKTRTRREEVNYFEIFASITFLFL